MEMITEHESKSQYYAGGDSDPMANWNEVLFLMRPWKGCMARMTEKWARLKQVFSRPELDVTEARTILKEMAVYAGMVRVLLDRDLESKS
jgi:hypothetical protein